MQLNWGLIMKVSGEVYAEYTISRIDKILASEPLSRRQRELVLATLAAQAKGVRHSFDLRISLPLFFRSYYFVLFAGRDRRQSTLKLQRLRYRRTMRSILRYLSLSSIIAFSFIGGVTLFWGLYSLKVALGIDLIPGFHLSDLWN